MARESRPKAVPQALHRAMRGLGSPVAVFGRCRSPYLGARKYRRIARVYPLPLARFRLPLPPHPPVRRPRASRLPLSPIHERCASSQSRPRPSALVGEVLWCEKRAILRSQPFGQKLMVLVIDEKLGCQLGCQLAIGGAARDNASRVVRRKSECRIDTAHMEAARTRSLKRARACHVLVLRSVVRANETYSHANETYSPATARRSTCLKSFSLSPTLAKMSPGSS